MQDERRLAGAVRAEHGDPLARRDVEVDAGERRAAVGVGEAEAADLAAPARHASASRPGDGTASDRGQRRERTSAASAARRGSRRRRRRSGHRAVVAPRAHRQVHPLAPLVRADEQRARPTTATARACQIHRGS